MNNTILQLAEKWLKLDAEIDKADEKSNGLWKVQDKLEKQIIRLLMKNALPKRFKGLSVKGNGISVRLPIHYSSWLRISKIKKK